MEKGQPQAWGPPHLCKGRGGLQSWAFREENMGGGGGDGGEGWQVWGIRCLLHTE